MCLLWSCGSCHRPRQGLNNGCWFLMCASERNWHGKHLLCMQALLSCSGHITLVACCYYGMLRLWDTVDLISAKKKVFWFSQLLAYSIPSSVYIICCHLVVTKLNGINFLPEVFLHNLLLTGCWILLLYSWKVPFETESANKILMK